jgi:hypothetical protein
MRHQRPKLAALRGENKANVIVRRRLKVLYCQSVKLVPEDLLCSAKILG